MAIMPHDPLREDDPVKGMEVEDDSVPDIGVIDLELDEEGGAWIPEPERGEPVTTEFDQNLAEVFPQSVLSSIATDLLEKLEHDRQSREERDKIYEEGLRRTGMDREASVGADFDGASRATHPLLVETSIEFEARAIKELFPSEGPVRTQIVGKQTEEKIEKADRKRTYLNWQLTKQMKEYRAEMEQLLTQVPLAGSQFLKVYYDRHLRRPKAEFIPADYIILPFSASSFYSARRKAHIIDRTQELFDEDVAAGLYIDIRLSSSSLPPEPSAAEEESRKIEGKEETGFNEDGNLRIFEVYTYYKLEDDTHTGGDSAPYIISVEETSRRVLSIYRNWDEQDQDRNELEWIVEFPFVPWRGALTAGLIHLIGGLSVAATGALNALLDSALVNNIPTALALKGTKITGQIRQVEPTTVQVVEGPAGVDDIRRIAMAMPYNPPSPVLFQLLGWLTDAAKSVVTTASEKLEDSKNTGPVGTTYALIEQGAMIFSAVHGRLHSAQARAIDIICRLNAKYLNDKEVVHELGELVVSKQDFLGPQDVIPVSDPSIFSEAQRWAQLQTVIALTQDQRVQYNMHAIHRRALKLLKFPNPEEVLPDQPRPQPTNPVAENVNAVRGLPMMVFPHEDHVAHLREHLAFANSPALAIIAGRAAPALMEHCQQHIAFLYASTAQMVASRALGRDITAFMVDDRLRNQIDGLLADASPHVHDSVTGVLGPFMQPLQQLGQLAAQNAPKPQLDPRSQVALQVGMAEVDRKTKADQANIQTRQQAEQADNALETMKFQLETRIAELESQLEQARLAQDRQADVEHVLQEIRKNQDDNQTKKEIEAMRLGMEQQLEQHKLSLESMIGQHEQRIAESQKPEEPKEDPALNDLKSTIKILEASQNNMATIINTLIQSSVAANVPKKKIVSFGKNKDGTYEGVIKEGDSE